MAAVEKRTVSLPAELARYIDTQVAKGIYASASEMVRAGLRALQEGDAGFERWLREEIAPTYDAMQADPSGAIPATRVLQNLRAHHTKRLKAKRGVWRRLRAGGRGRSRFSSTSTSPGMVERTGHGAMSSGS
ncbi:MAG: type II toxin-antitoxin system ParD family antitoxin [Acetobacteraceae bacterium]